MGFSFGAKSFLGRVGAAAVLALFVSLSTTPARAGIVLGAGSAVAGSEVSLTVSGTYTIFSSALFGVTYNETHLSFLRAEASDYALDLTPGYWTQALPGQVNLNLGLAASAPVPGPNLLSYFKLVFMVNNVAPGFTSDIELLDLNSNDPAFVFDVGNGDFQEVRIDSGPRIISSVTTLAGATTAVPIGNTLALVLPALGLVALGRRRLVAKPV